jgi:hypothetical protein
MRRPVIAVIALAIGGVCGAAEPAPAAPEPRRAIEGPVELEGKPVVGLKSFNPEPPIEVLLSVAIEARPTGHEYFLGITDVHVDEAVTDAGERLRSSARYGQADAKEVPAHLVTIMTFVLPDKPAKRLSVRGSLALASDGPLRAVRMRCSPTPTWTSVRGYDGLSLAAVSGDTHEEILLSGRFASLFAGAMFYSDVFEPDPEYRLMSGSDDLPRVSRAATSETASTSVEVRFFDPARLVRCPFVLDDLPLPEALPKPSSPPPAETPAADASASSYRCSSIGLVD